MINKNPIIKRTTQKKFLRGMAQTLILCLFIQEFAYAAPELLKKDIGSWVSVASQKQKSLKWAKKILPKIPGSVASIDDAWKSSVSVKERDDMTLKSKIATSLLRASRNDRVVILIQDAHTNASAQTNESKLFDILFQSNIIDTVYTEAAKGNVNLTFLRDKASLYKRKQIAKAYLQKGILHGIEYLDLTSEHNFKVEGVEDPSLYYESIDVYRHSLKKRDKYKAYLGKIESTINVLKPKLLNPYLLEFLESYTQVQKEEISFSNYIDILFAQAQLLNLNLKDQPNLQKLKKLKAMEDKIDFETVSLEQQQAIQSLSPEDQEELGDLSLSKLTLKDSQRGFFALLTEKLAKVEGGLSNYPNLAKYLRYLEQSKDLGLADTLNEQKLLEEKIFETLSANDDEAKLLLALKVLQFYKKLFSLSLTPEEYEAFKNENFANLKVLTGFLNQKLMTLKKHYNKALFLKEDFSDMATLSKRFYELTYARDQKFLENMNILTARETGDLKSPSLRSEWATNKEPMLRTGRVSEALSRKRRGNLSSRNSNISALITGGYHTPNLKHLLKQNNISYISITPQVTHETNTQRYEQILLNQPINNLVLPAMNTATTKHAMNPYLAPNAEVPSVFTNRFLSELGVDGRTVSQVRMAKPSESVFGDYDFPSPLIGVMSVGSRLYLGATKDGAEQHFVKLPANKNFAEVIAREAQLIRVLKSDERISPLIPDVIQSGTATEDDVDSLSNLFEGEPYIILKKADGISVINHIESMRDSDKPVEAIEVLAQIAEALATLHNVTDQWKAVYHRDLKPSDIFINKKGSAWSVQFIDWGLSTIEGQKLGKTIQDFSENALSDVDMGDSGRRLDYAGTDSYSGKILDKPLLRDLRAFVAIVRDYAYILGDNKAGYLLDDLLKRRASYPTAQSYANVLQQFLIENKDSTTSTSSMASKPDSPIDDTQASNLDSNAVRMADSEPVYINLAWAWSMVKTFLNKYKPDYASRLDAPRSIPFDIDLILSPESRQLIPPSNMDEEILVILIKDVLSNAFVEPDDGRVRVSFEQNEDKTLVTLKIENQNPIDYDQLMSRAKEALDNKQLYINDLSPHRLEVILPTDRSEYSAEEWQNLQLVDSEEKFLKVLGELGGKERLPFIIGLSRGKEMDPVLGGGKGVGLAMIHDVTSVLGSVFNLESNADIGTRVSISFATRPPSSARMVRRTAAVTRIEKSKEILEKVERTHTQTGLVRWVKKLEQLQGSGIERGVKDVFKYGKGDEGAKLESAKRLVRLFHVTWRADGSPEGVLPEVNARGDGRVRNALLRKYSAERIEKGIKNVREELLEPSGEREAPVVNLSKKIKVLKDFKKDSGIDIDLIASIEYKTHTGRPTLTGSFKRRQFINFFLENIEKFQLKNPKRIKQVFINSSGNAIQGLLFTVKVLKETGLLPKDFTVVMVAHDNLDPTKKKKIEKKYPGDFEEILFIGDFIEQAKELGDVLPADKTDKELHKELEDINALLRYIDLYVASYNKKNPKAPIAHVLPSNGESMALGGASIARNLRDGAKKLGLGEIDTIIEPLGGGGPIAGAGIEAYWYKEEHDHDTKVVGVTSNITVSALADGMAIQAPQSEAMAAQRALGSEAVAFERVPEKFFYKAWVDLQDAGYDAEPTSAASLAYIYWIMSDPSKWHLLKHEDPKKKKVIAFMLSGSNYSKSTLKHARKIYKTENMSGYAYIKAQAPEKQKTKGVRMTIPADAEILKVFSDSRAEVLDRLVNDEVEGLILDIEGNQYLVDSSLGRENFAAWVIVDGAVQEQKVVLKFTKTPGEAVSTKAYHEFRQQLPPDQVNESLDIFVDVLDIFVDVLDVYDEGIDIVVMEYIEGTMLNEIDDTQKQLEHLSSAWKVLHVNHQEYGLFHGEPVAKNIIVTPSGDERLIDLDDIIVLGAQPDIEKFDISNKYADIYYAGQAILELFEIHLLGDESALKDAVTEVNKPFDPDVAKFDVTVDVARSKAPQGIIDIVQRTLPVKGNNAYRSIKQIYTDLDALIMTPNWDKDPNVATTFSLGAKVVHEDQAWREGAVDAIEGATVWVDFGNERNGYGNNGAGLSHVDVSESLPGSTTRMAVQKPIVDMRPDADRVKALIEAQGTPLLQRLMAFLMRHMTYITQAVFEEKLELSVEQFNNNNEREFAVAIIDNVSPDDTSGVMKSNGWTYQIARGMGLRAPKEEISATKASLHTHTTDWLKKPENRAVNDVLFIDDAAYSGRQIEDWLDKVAFALSTEEEFVQRTITIHLAIPFMTNNAKDKLENLAQKFNDHVQRQVLEIQFYDQVIMKNLDEILLAAEEDVREEFGRIFSSDFKKPLTYFEHIRPDYYSTPYPISKGQFSLMEGLVFDAAGEVTHTIPIMPPISKKPYDRDYLTWIQKNILGGEWDSRVDKASEIALKFDDALSEAEQFEERKAGVRDQIIQRALALLEDESLDPGLKDNQFKGEAENAVTPASVVRRSLGEAYQNATYRSVKGSQDEVRVSASILDDVVEIKVSNPGVLRTKGGSENNEEPNDQARFQQLINFGSLITFDAATAFMARLISDDANQSQLGMSILAHMMTILYPADLYPDASYRPNQLIRLEPSGDRTEFILKLPLQPLRDRQARILDSEEHARMSENEALDELLPAAQKTKLKSELDPNSDLPGDDNLPGLRMSALAPKDMSVEKFKELFAPVDTSRTFTTLYNGIGSFDAETVLTPDGDKDAYLEFELKDSGKKFFGQLLASEMLQNDVDGLITDTLRDSPERIMEGRAKILAHKQGDYYYPYGILFFMKGSPPTLLTTVDFFTPSKMASDRYEVMHTAAKSWVDTHIARNNYIKLDGNKLYGTFDFSRRVQVLDKAKVKVQMIEGHRIESNMPWRDYLDKEISEDDRNSSQHLTLLALTRTMPGGNSFPVMMAPDDDFSVDWQELVGEYLERNSIAGQEVSLVGSGSGVDVVQLFKAGAKTVHATDLFDANVLMTEVNVQFAKDLGWIDKSATLYATKQNGIAGGEGVSLGLFNAPGINIGGEDATGLAMSSMVMSLEQFMPFFKDLHAFLKAAPDGHRRFVLRLNVYLSKDGQSEMRPGDENVQMIRKYIAEGYPDLVFRSTDGTFFEISYKSTEVEATPKTAPFTLESTRRIFGDLAANPLLTEYFNSLGQTLENISVFEDKSSGAKRGFIPFNLDEHGRQFFFDYLKPEIRQILKKTGRRPDLLNGPEDDLKVNSITATSYILTSKSGDRNIPYAILIYTAMGPIYLDLLELHNSQKTNPETIKKQHKSVHVWVQKFVASEHPIESLKRWKTVHSHLVLTQFTRVPENPRTGSYEDGTGSTDFQNPWYKATYALDVFPEENRDPKKYLTLFALERYGQDGEVMDVTFTPDHPFSVDWQDRIARLMEADAQIDGFVKNVDGDIEQGRMYADSAIGLGGIGSGVDALLLARYGVKLIRGTDIYEAPVILSRLNAVFAKISDQIHPDTEFVFEKKSGLPSITSDLSHFMMNTPGVVMDDDPHFKGVLAETNMSFSSFTIPWSAFTALFTDTNGIDEFLRVSEETNFRTVLLRMFISLKEGELKEDLNSDSSLVIDDFLNRYDDFDFDELGDHFFLLSKARMAGVSEKLLTAGAVSQGSRVFELKPIQNELEQGVDEEEVVTFVAHVISEQSRAGDLVVGDTLLHILQDAEGQYWLEGFGGEARLIDSKAIVLNDRGDKAQVSMSMSDYQMLFEQAERSMEPFFKGIPESITAIKVVEAFDLNILPSDNFGTNIAYQIKRYIKERRSDSNFVVLFHGDLWRMDHAMAEVRDLPERDQNLFVQDLADLPVEYLEDSDDVRVVSIDGFDVDANRVITPKIPAVGQTPTRHFVTRVLNKGELMHPAAHRVARLEARLPILGPDSEALFERFINAYETLLGRKIENIEEFTLVLAGLVEIPNLSTYVLPAFLRIDKILQALRMAKRMAEQSA
ncbi:MAG: tRNA A-37 threonylcarbamoyl transferase component Bud32 [Candidatus Omnitrophota bacterium]|jgi:tRNA A-37 threonylcarbamoyl transferase component Bud32